MFHSAALRLTGWYLAIIVAISILFSAALYRVSSNELGRNATRQIGYFNNLLGPDEFDNYTTLRQHQLGEDRNRLKANLAVFNLMVLIGGGAVSYWLARRTLEPIEDALAAQSRFAADASHELRTPLTSIQSENEVALRNPKLTKADAISILKSNLEEVAKLKLLSDGLLKLAAGDVKVGDYQKLSVKQIVQTATVRLAKPANQKRIKIVDETKQMFVRGELTSLSEVLNIFIDNALKYSPPGSKVTIRSQKRHKYIVISVIDEGKGIAAGDLPNIFKRFYRADTSRTSSTGGHGLGLAIAKKIAEAHNGHIEVTSQPDKGSTFSLYLPCA